MKLILKQIVLKCFQNHLKDIFFLLLFLMISFQYCSTPITSEVIHQKYIPTKYGNIFVLTNDCFFKSKLLVLIHGSPGSSSDFTLYLEDEDFQKQYCILVPDRLGFGQSVQNEFLPSLKEQANAIVEMVLIFLQKEGNSFDSYKILGHSYGGPVALTSLIELQKKGIKKGKLVLVSAPIDPNYEELRFYNHIAKFPIIEFFLPNAWVRSNLEMFTLKKDLEHLGNDLKGNKFPVISIHGDEDGIVPVENVFYLDSIFFQGKHQVYRLKGGSHFIPWTRYSEMKTILLGDNL